MVAQWEGLIMIFPKLVLHVGIPTCVWMYVRRKDAGSTPWRAYQTDLGAALGCGEARGAPGQSSAEFDKPGTKSRRAEGIQGDPVRPRSSILAAPGGQSDETTDPAT